MEQKKKNLIFYISSVVCFVLGLAFAIVLITISNKKVTLGKEYVFKFGNMGDIVYMELDITFDEKTYSTDAYVQTESENSTGNLYKISNGYLYVKVDNDDWNRIGKISATELEIDFNNYDNSVAETMRQVIGTDKLTLTCKSAKTLKIISIVLSIMGFAASVAIMLAKVLLDYLEKQKSTKLLLESYQTALNNQQNENSTEEEQNQ